MKQKWIDAFMDTAERFAQLSSAKRLKVGSGVVKDNRIISIGYNGMPSGWSNDCEKKVYADAWSIDNNHWDYLEEDGTAYNLVTKEETIHAEQNAVMKLARDGESGSGAVLFCTHAPCIHCAKLIYGAGISSVYYRNSYRDTDGLDFLSKCNIELNKV
jgi:dCMP deaminase